MIITVLGNQFNEARACWGGFQRSNDGSGWERGVSKTLKGDRERNDGHELILALKDTR